ncbi:uncharacterized protein LOC143875795 isoform X2 [Tasmannia lanceolata]|uniref:uncharacterized protein LOC143875795 isoform X2 n=1 Tax=Tasmannia lanceolata TaxID=3420 RepID=UPI0040641255
MELHHLSFLPSEIDESEVDFRPFSDHPPAAFSPTPSNYESFFEAMEMELGKSSGTLPSFTCSNVDEEKKGNEEENDEGRGGKGNLENAGCKHLQRERNRRMRLNQQLLALRSLVPCISKSIHQEIDQITREISTQEASDGLTTSFESNLSSPREIPRDSSSIHHQILQIDAEKLDDQIFILKLIFRRAHGAPGRVQRLLESLGFHISHTWTHGIDQHQMITTSFIHVKKNMDVTPETLRTQVNRAASKFGLEVEMPY